MHLLGFKIAAERQNPQNSLLISLLAGNLAMETGSIQAASTTTQSSAKRGFLLFAEYPRFSAGAWGRLRFEQHERWTIALHELPQSGAPIYTADSKILAS